MGENLYAQYKLIGSDGTTLSGGGEGGNTYRCRPGRLQSSSESPPGPGTRSTRLSTCLDGCLRSTTTSTVAPASCRLLHIVEGGDYGYRFRSWTRKGLQLVTAWNAVSCPARLGMVAGTGEARRAASSNTIETTSPKTMWGHCWCTSWGDHRIEQYRLEPHGASFHFDDEAGWWLAATIFRPGDRGRPRRCSLHQ